MLKFQHRFKEKDIFLNTIIISTACRNKQEGTRGQCTLRIQTCLKDIITRS